MSNLAKHVTLHDIYPVTDLTKLHIEDDGDAILLTIRIPIQNNTDEYWVNGWHGRPSHPYKPREAKRYTYTKRIEKHN